MKCRPMLSNERGFLLPLNFLRMRISHRVWKPEETDANSMG